MSAINTTKRPFHFRLQTTRLFSRVLPFLGLLVILLISCAEAETSGNPPVIQTAAAFDLPQLPKVPGLSSLTGPSASWQQFDSFFTFIVKRFGDDVPANLKDSLGDAFLDSRYELTSAIAPGKGGNPVPEWVSNGWKRGC